MIFSPDRFHSNMKQTNPQNEKLAALRLEFHPDRSACRPKGKEFVSSASIPDLKGCKTSEWETSDETLDDTPVFDFSREYLIITGLHRSRLSI